MVRQFSAQRATLTKIGQVKIISFDEEDPTLAGVRDGSTFATVVQQPFEFGYQAIQLMHKWLKNDGSFVPPSKQIYIPTLVIKRNNVEEFTKKMTSFEAGAEDTWVLVTLGD